MSEKFQGEDEFSPRGQEAPEDMPLEEWRVQVARIGAFVEDDVLCPIVIDVENGFGLEPP